MEYGATVHNRSVYVALCDCVGYDLIVAVMRQFIYICVVLA